MASLGSKIAFWPAKANSMRLALDSTPSWRARTAALFDLQPLVIAKSRGSQSIQQYDLPKLSNLMSDFDIHIHNHNLGLSGEDFLPGPDLA
jgi:hypothetical protein